MYSKNIFIIIISMRTLCLCTENFENCRFGKEGSEYVGNMSYSRTGDECIYWKDNGDRHIDAVFPDGSKIKAKNYCRNPTRDTSGPWCYIRKDPLQKEFCDVPYCYSYECRWTGIGEEYYGTTTKSAAGKECNRWSSTEFSKHEVAKFLCWDKNSAECESCRNLDASESGPWCYARDGYVEKKQLCDIPFCHDNSILLLLGEINQVCTFHRIFNTTAASITAKFRLWQPRDWLQGQIVILLSVFDVPTSIADVRRWGSGVMISLQNALTAIVGSEIYDSSEIPGVLTATKWTEITVAWKRSPDNNIVVSLYLNNDRKPVLIADLDTTSSVLEANDFQFFGVMGTMSFWEFSSQPETCLVTTTSQGHQTMWLELERVSGQADIEIFFRIFQKAVLHLRGSPTSVDLIRIELFRSGRVLLEDLSEKKSRRISDLTITPFDYWSWERINMSLLGDHLLILRPRDSGVEVAANVTGVNVLRQLLWIGMSSRQVSHWAFNCDPSEIDETPKPEPPECLSSTSGLEYNGSQYIAASGKHCVPWIDNRIPDPYESNEYFENFGGRLNSVNFCRNLDMDPSGVFCFVQRSLKDPIVEKELCSIRPCLMGECKHAGVGTDYVGKHVVTRSQRVCAAQFKNETNAYCRNPTKNIGGPWCHTEDPLLPKDFCEIKDCDRPGTGIMLTSTTKNNSNFYILPAWRKVGVHFWLKNWNPEHDSSVLITMTPMSERKHYQLLIGGGSNDKIQLKFIEGSSEQLLFEETGPRLVRSGGWSGLWLRCGLGSVELGHESMDVPFFEWESSSTETKLQILPRFLSFGTRNNAWAGVSFRPSECLVERVWGNTAYQLWPLDLWKDPELENRENSVTFFVQGNGTVAINFVLFPGEDRLFSLTIENGTKIFWIRQSNGQRQVLRAQELLRSAINDSSWSELTVRHGHEFITVDMNGGNVLTYETAEDVLVFYWFYVEVQSGLFTWAANCVPLELGGKPRNGGWSPWGAWTCSAPCGGGEGRRERACTSPVPNLLGEECVGPAVYEGVCNDFECGDAPPSVLKDIRKILARTAISLAATKGEPVRFHCNDDLAAVLMENVPEVMFEWTLNGFLFNSTQRASFSGFTLDLHSVDTPDSGVWGCVASWSVSGSDKSLVVSIASLVVTSSAPTMYVRRSLSFTLHSNAVVLGHVYGDLSQRWEINGALWRDYGPSLLGKVAVEVVTSVNWEEAGVWTCVISQEELGLQWTTAWIRVQVISAPNFWTHLIEDKATAPFFGTMNERTAKIVFGVSIFVIIAIPIILVAIYNSL